MIDLALLEESPETMREVEGTFRVASSMLRLRTDQRVELKVITAEIAALVARSGVCDGFAQISSLHTTAGVILNEAQGALLDDVASLFEQVVPRAVYYKHNDPQLSDCDRKNADAHLRAIVAGLNLTLPIVDGRLRLGTWQNVIFAEFDGPNLREVHVQVCGV